MISRRRYLPRHGASRGTRARCRSVEARREPASVSRARGRRSIGPPHRPHDAPQARDHPCWIRDDPSREPAGCRSGSRPSRRGILRSGSLLLLANRGPMDAVTAVAAHRVSTSKLSRRAGLSQGVPPARQVPPPLSDGGAARGPEGEAVGREGRLDGGAPWPRRRKRPRLRSRPGWRSVRARRTSRVPGSGSSP